MSNIIRKIEEKFHVGGSKEVETQYNCEPKKGLMDRIKNKIDDKKKKRKEEKTEEKGKGREKGK